MNFREFADKNIVILDGAMGSMLEAAGLVTGERSESICLTSPSAVRAVHRAYYESGANVVNTNTFGASALRYGEEELRAIISAAVSCADEARREAAGNAPRYIALDIGPLGRLLKPFGTLDFEEAYRAFSAVVSIGASLGVDLITVETMTSTLEAKAALLAVKDNCDLPVMVTVAPTDGGKLLSGATPEAVVALLEGLGADYIGVNCSAGPQSLLPVLERLVAVASVPVVFKPNAGLPTLVGGKTVYDLAPGAFGEYMKVALEGGARLVGGCCGTTPEYIKILADIAQGYTPCHISPKNSTVISSFAGALNIGERLTVIGEGINPTGKRLMREAVKRGDVDFISDTAIAQAEAGADALDVNVGVPEINESEFLPHVIELLQYYVALPLCIDTASPEAMERALRIYDGKPLINSVSGKAESMASVFPLQKKYGGVVIALTLDENGIPDTAEGRLAIARRILSTAAEYGIAERDIIFDPLALTVSAGQGNARVTLDAIRMINEELGCKTSLGVSNVSYGLPGRPALNSTFLSMATAAGLKAAIMNPLSLDMMRAARCSDALLGMDTGFERYLEYNSENADKVAPVSDKAQQITLFDAIVRGMCDTARTLASDLLSTSDALDIINVHVVPALNKVGEGFESGRIYLPGLLLAADAAAAAFEVIRLAKGDAAAGTRGRVLLATVKGDIHDIGKNIVKLLLENYGFSVNDLGRDVSAERIDSALAAEHYDVLALSALMTTTAREMQSTVEFIKPRHPDTHIIVGGAVITEQFADEIGADGYAPDAMGAVRLCERLVGAQSE